MTTTTKTDSDYSAKYNAKRKAKQVNVPFYLDDPVEKQMYETWQKEPNKKQLLIKLYAEHLAKKD